MTRHKTEFKNWCAENNYTAKDVAERIGISLPSVYAYMEGRRTPSRRTQKKMEEVFGVSMRDVFPL